MASAGVVEACPVCYGNGEGKMVDAARSGTFLLLGIVVLMQFAFAAFFLYLRRAAQRANASAPRGDAAGEFRSMNS